MKYTFQSFQKDQFWLPAALWGLFVLMIVVFFEGANQTNGVRSFLGFVLPLLAGILGAYALLEDSAIELYFATPRPSWRMLANKLGLILLIILLTGFSFQLLTAIMRIDSGMGNPVATFLAWLVPSYTALTLGALISLASANSNAGAAFIGGLWILQTLARGWFARDEIARYILLFFATMAPGHADVVVNQIVLTAISAICIWLSWILLKKQERYI